VNENEKKIHKFLSLWNQISQGLVVDEPIFRSTFLLLLLFYCMVVKKRFYKFEFLKSASFTAGKEELNFGVSLAFLLRFH